MNKHICELQIKRFCFQQLEYYEQSSLDVQPDKKTKARNFSSEEAPKIVGFWQVPG